MGIVYQKEKMTLHFKKDKPQVFRAKPVRQQPVAFEDLLNEVSNSCGVNRSQTKAVIEALIDRMTVFMNYGMPVKLGDFGSFKPTFNSKSASTAEEVSADSVTRKKILFYPGKRFKQMLEGMSVITMEDFDEEEEEETNPPAGGGTDPDGNGSGTGEGEDDGGGGFG